MMRCFFLVTILLSITACDKRYMNSACRSISETSDKRSAEIQAYLKDSHFYQKRAMYEKGLSLKSLMDSVQGFVIRFWNSDMPFKQLYRLRCSNSGEWIGEKYDYRYLRDSVGPYTKGTGQLISKSNKEWETFLDRVFKNGLLEFPDYKTVSKYSKKLLPTDGTSFVCEAACGEKYFFYQFIDPFYDHDSVPIEINKVIRDFDSTFHN